MTTTTTTATEQLGFVGDGDQTAPVLWATSVEDARWNGWSSPIVTAAQLAAWVEQTMDGTHVHEAGGDLFIADPADAERWSDWFRQVGLTSDGDALYSLNGWCFLPYTGTDEDDDDEPECRRCGTLLDAEGCPADRDHARTV